MHKTDKPVSFGYISYNIFGKNRELEYGRSRSRSAFLSHRFFHLAICLREDIYHLGGLTTSREADRAATFYVKRADNRSFIGKT